VLEKFIPHRYIFIFFLSVLIIGISTGKIFMSIGTIGLTVNWVFEGGFKNKVARIKSQFYTAIILSSGYLIHLLWLINSDNLHYASKDLLVKLPLFLIPLVIGSSANLNKLEKKIILKLFFVGVLISTILSSLVYFHILPPKESAENVFQIALFMSHIRMGLLVSFTSILLFYLAANTHYKYKKGLFLLGVYFFLFLLILQSMTAIISWFCGVSVLVLFSNKIRKRNKKYVFFTWGILISLAFLYVFFIGLDFYTIKDNRILKQLPKTSYNGELYHHDTINKYTENGYYVWVCIAPNELKRAWSKRSRIPIDSNDIKGQVIRYNLYRYLTSLGLNKDSLGLRKLSPDDIIAIENGKTSSIEYSRLEERIRGIFFELKLYKDGIETNGHSVSQRLFFMKIGVQIIKENLLFGVGIGDVNDSFIEQYLKTPNDLKKENQMRSHNQFLSFLISYGIVGFSLWLITILFPIYKIKPNSSLYYIFMVIMIVGFLSDDMLERQAGVAIYITINTLLLFSFYSIDGDSNVLARTKRTPNINS